MTLEVVYDTLVIEKEKSSVKIESIEKNATDFSVELGEVIPIFENEAYDEEHNINYHIAGYQKMLMDNEYLLLLKHADGNDWYIPTGVVSGKIPQDEEERKVYSDDEEIVQNVENIVDEAKIEYNDLLSED